MKLTYILIIGSLIMLAYACEDSGDIKFSRSDSVQFDSNDGGSGQGGSMARFSVVGDYLYAVDDQNLMSFDISDPKNIVKKSSHQIDWWGVETIFPLGDKLFLGTSSGMHIMDISDPNNIYKVSTYEHVVSCDPVVAKGNYAYVTLNSSQFRCGRNVNQLQIIDISNISNPVKVKTYPMTSPKGLGVSGTSLFVCDNDVLKVFDSSDPRNLVLTSTFPAKGTYDVIPYNDILILISDEGFKQYSNDDGNLTLLSSISTSK